MTTSAITFALEIPKGSLHDDLMPILTAFRMMTNLRACTKIPRFEAAECESPECTRSVHEDDERAANKEDGHFSTRPLIFAALAAVLGPISFVWASGFSKPVQIGPKAIGMGGAFVGIADDATAVYHNPAAMSQLKGTHFFLGGDALITDLDYTPQNNGVDLGATERAKREFLPVPSGAVTHRFFDRFTLGVGVFFPHGNGGTFSTASSPLTVNPLKGMLYSMELTPAVSITLIEGLDIGASFRASRVSFSLEGQPVPLVDFPTPGSTTIAQLNDIDASGWGLGYSASLFYHRFKPISFGFNYRSQINADLSGDLDLAPLGTGDVTVKQKLPEQYNVGLGLHMCEEFTLGVGYQFEQNSVFRNFEGVSQVVGGTLTLPQNWRDSHTWMIGAEARPIKPLALRFGYARDFDSSVPDESQNRISGDIAAHEVSAGIGYQWKKFNFGAAWNGRFGDRDVPGSPVLLGGTAAAPGNYSAFVHMLSLGVGYAL